MVTLITPNNYTMYPKLLHHSKFHIKGHGMSHVLLHCINPVGDNLAYYTLGHIKAFSKISLK